MKQIKCSEFEKEVIEAKKMVVVLFTNEWSGSAIIIEGSLSALQKKWSESFCFVEVSKDECQEVGQKFNIQYIPTILIFDGGKVVEKISGVPSKNTIEKILESLNSIA